MESLIEMLAQVSIINRVIGWAYGQAVFNKPNAVGRRDSVILFTPPDGMSAGSMATKLHWDYDVKYCAHAFHGRWDGQPVFSMHVSSKQRKWVARLMLTMGALLWDGDLLSLQPFERMPKPWKQQRRKAQRRWW